MDHRADAASTSFISSLALSRLHFHRSDPFEVFNPPRFDFMYDVTSF